MPLSQTGAWTGAAKLLQQIWTASSGSAAPAGTAPASTAPAGASADSSSAAARAPAVYTGLEQTLAVICSDSPNPDRPAAYAAQDQLASARAGGFGLEWLWTSEACAQWPGHAEDRYTGPWNRPTAGTILLLGNTGDPDTPYADSVAMSHDLARTRLLTVAGYGHTEQANLSSCAVNYELGYLQTGALPAAGTVCAEDKAPFPAPLVTVPPAGRGGAGSPPSPRSSPRPGGDASPARPGPGRCG
jgi:hypothetical protein